MLNDDPNEHPHVDQLDRNRARSDKAAPGALIVTPDEEVENRHREEARARLAIAEEIMRRYPEEFAPQRSARLLGIGIILLAFGAIVMLALSAEAIWAAFGL